MKKIGLFLVAFCTMLLSGVLAACSFKNPTVSFDDEIVLSVDHKTQDVDQIMKVDGTDVQNITLISSDTQLFTVSGHIVTAGEKSGRGFLYAYFENNTIGSVSVVVTQKFAAPTNVKYENGVLSWDAVQQYFQGDSLPTTAVTYIVSGTYSADGRNFSNFQDKVSNATSLALTDGGAYHLAVSATGTGYFETSDFSQFVDFSFNSMPLATNLRVEDDILLWDSTAQDAQFQVEIDGTLIGTRQTEKSRSLDSLPQGSHTVRVVTYDATSQNRVLSLSQSLSVRKLATPVARFDDGKLVLPFVFGAEKFEISASGQTFEVANLQDGTSTFLQGLQAGTHNIAIVAKGENCVSSNSQNIENVKKLGVLSLTQTSAVAFDAFEVSVSGVEENCSVVLKGLDEDVVTPFDQVQDGAVKISVAPTQPKTYQLFCFQSASGNVLRSDDSQSISFTRVADFSGDVTHQLDEDGNSVFLFPLPEFATNAELVIEGSEKEIKYETQGDGRIFVENGIAQYFDSSRATIKIVALADGNCLATFREHTLSKVATPTSLAQQSSEQTFSWNASPNAKEYVVKVFKIDAQQHAANTHNDLPDAIIKTADNFLEKGQTYQTTDGKQFVLDVGYFCFEVTAFPLADNSFVQSDALTEYFFLYDNLTMPEIEFGQDREGRFFVRVGKTENVASFDFAIGENSSNVMAQDKTTYVVSQNSFSSLEISITANAEDKNLHKSVTTTLSVDKIDALSSDKILTDKLCEKISVLPIENVSKIVIFKDEENRAVGSDSTAAVFDASKFDKFSLTFSLIGSPITQGSDGDQLFQISQNQVYLPAEDVSFEFERLSAPSNLLFDNGSLKATHENAANAPSFVVRLLAEDQNNFQYDILIDVQSNALDVTVDKLQDGVITSSSPFQISTPESLLIKDGTNVSVDLNKAISLLQENVSDFADIYMQLQNLKIGLYAFSRSDGLSKISITSRAASIYSSSQEWLTVSKLDQVGGFAMEVEGGYRLSWDNPAKEFASDTKYDVFEIAGDKTERLAQDLEANSFVVDFSRIAGGESKQYYVQANNSHFLTSSNSVHITIHKLKQVQSVTLAGNTLTFEVETPSFVSQIKLSANGVPSDLGATARSFQIGEAGTYTLQLVGLNEENTYHVSSEVSTWTLSDLSGLLPEDKTLTIDTNGLSWQSAKESLTNLKYVLLFKDEEGKLATILTTKNKLSFDTLVANPDFAALTGKISAQLCLWIDSSVPYSVANEGKVYFAKETALLSGQTLPNYAIVCTSDQSIKKLSTPVVDEVRFLENGGLSGAEFPTIEIVLVGTDGGANFEGTTNFRVQLNDIVLEDEDFAVSALEDGKYVLTLTKDHYNRFAPGEKIVVKIFALSDQSSHTLPSATKEIEILRANTLKSAKFVEDKFGFAKTLQLDFEEGSEVLARNGVILELEIGGEKTYVTKAFDSVSDDQMSVDLSDFVQNHTDGGVVSVRVFVRSATGVPYVLSGGAATVSAEILPAIKSESIKIQEGGFVIDQPLSAGTIVLLQCNGKTFEIAQENGVFAFNFPDEWQAGIQYDVSFVATRKTQTQSFVASAETKTQVTLTRISQVQSVTLVRDKDTNQVKFVWKHVDGAKSYRFDVFLNEEESPKVSTEIFVLESAGVGEEISALVSDIFGANYEKLGLTEEQKQQDQKLVFHLVSVAKTANNSLSYIFSGTLLANHVKEANVSVNSFGQLQFESRENQPYIFRLVDGEGANVLPWTEIVGQDGVTILDTESVDGNKVFGLQLALMGSADEEGTISSNDFSFAFDSVALSTAVGIEKLADIVSIGLDDQDVGKLAFTLKNISSSYQMFVSTFKDGSQKVAFEFVDPSRAGSSGESIFVYDFSKLLDLLSENGQAVSAEAKLYFWAFAPDAQNVVASSVKEFAFNMSAETNLKKIEKLGLATGNESIKQDFVSTLAIFEGDAVGTQTLGFYVKVTAQDQEFLIFKKAAEVLPTTYHQNENVFVLNLADLFESEDLINISGSVSVKFARLCTGAAGAQISSWQDSVNQDESTIPLTFVRLERVTDITMSEGNLSWKANLLAEQRYFVYRIGERPEDDRIPQNSAFSFDEVSGNVYNASEFAFESGQYYFAVRAIANDAFVISSAPAFYDQAVFKNQITNKIKLEDGRLVIDWTGSDFYDLLTGVARPELDANTRGRALLSTTFQIPFTFTLRQLLDGNVRLRLRLTPLLSPEGAGRTFTIDAWEVLASLEKKNSGIEDTIRELVQGAQDSTVNTYLTRLLEKVQEGKDGLASEQILFDDYFEVLGEGGYSLQYYLVGNSESLNSSWVGFENDSLAGQNALYVNSHPHVKVIVEEKADDLSQSSYKVVFEKTKIYGADGQKTEYATKYVLKIGKRAFVIADGAGYESGLHAGQSFGVYECDENGNQGANGYLMFYLNRNLGSVDDSLFAKYDISGERQDFEVYAVGDSVSLSSKTEKFHLTILQFDDFEVADGRFVWTAGERATTIFLKRPEVDQEAKKVTVGANGTECSFALENEPEGTYDVKFVRLGNHTISGYEIVVDSMVYEVEKVVKLQRPTLSNELGLVNINGTANYNDLAQCYSTQELYAFRLSNNIAESSNLSTTIFDKRVDKRGALTYMPGEREEEDAYKQTEDVATSFSVCAVGSTAQLAVTDTQDKFMKKLQCFDGEQTNDKAVAVSSEKFTQAMTMFGAVQEVRVEQGMLVWDAVDGKSATLQAPKSEEEKVIYRVSVTRYQNTNGQGDVFVQTPIDAEPFVFHTAKTEFDFVNIPKDNNLDVFIKVSVCATVMQYSKTVIGQTTGVSLVEGGYAYGNGKFDTTLSQSEVLAVFGNSATETEIGRINPVDEGSLKVSAGSLMWNYTISGFDTTSLLQRYQFVVEDDTGKQIDGETELRQEGSTFTVTFHEGAGKMKVGTYSVTVYVTQAAGIFNKQIKSFGTSLVITKLESVTSDQYEITASDDNTYETLDLSSYFLTHPANTVTATILGQTYRLTSARNKLMILSENPASSVRLPDETYVAYVVIESEASVSFVVSDGTNISSDASEEFSLNRISWQDQQISWDEERQVFSWDFAKRMLKQSATALPRKFADIVNRNTQVYASIEDWSSGTTVAGIIIARNSEIEVLQNLGSVCQIRYQQQEYFISTENVTFDSLQVAEGAEITLDSKVMFEIVGQVTENRTNYTLIRHNDNLYIVESECVSEPEFIVTATYQTTNGNVIRTYVIRQMESKVEFVPTIIGRVSIGVRVKLNDSSVQSEALIFGGESQQFEMFDLFAKGQGTQESPYIISTQEQFRNIAYRMEKPSYLASYVSGTQSYSDNSPFCFKIGELQSLQLSLGQISGILFKGSFGGQIDGNNSTISFTSSEVSQLSSSVSVVSGNYASSTGNLIFTHGSAIFERISQDGHIQNLNIQAKFGDSPVRVSSNALVSGLAIVNNGQISQVGVTGFENLFYGDTSGVSTNVIAYSGLVSVNESTSRAARISQCTVSSNISIQTNRSVGQAVFVGAVAFTNRGEISDCQTTAGGHISVYCQNDTDFVQAAGIVVTNDSTGTLTNCTNAFDITADAANRTNRVTAYLGGVCARDNGSRSVCQNSGRIDGGTITNVVQGDVSAA